MSVAPSAGWTRERSRRPRQGREIPVRPSASPKRDFAASVRLCGPQALLVARELARVSRSATRSVVPAIAPGGATLVGVTSRAGARAIPVGPPYPRVGLHIGEGYAYPHRCSVNRHRDHREAIALALHRSFVSAMAPGLVSSWIHGEVREPHLKERLPSVDNVHECHLERVEVLEGRHDIVSNGERSTEQVAVGHARVSSEVTGDARRQWQ